MAKLENEISRQVATESQQTTEAADRGLKEEGITSTLCDELSPEELAALSPQPSEPSLLDANSDNIAHGLAVAGAGITVAGSFLKQRRLSRGEEVQTNDSTNSPTSADNISHAAAAAGVTVAGSLLKQVRMGEEQNEESD